MARILENLVNVAAPDADFPFGRIQNDTGSADGTPINEASHGDRHVFFAKLMDEAGVVPNDLPDNTTNGFQLFEAFDILVNGENLKLHGHFNERLSLEDFGPGPMTFPTDFAITNGKAYVTDEGTDEVFVFDLKTGNNLPLEGFGSGDLNNPQGIFIKGGKAYVVDAVQAEVVVFDIAAKANIPGEDFGIGSLTGPVAIFIEGDKAYITDATQDEVVVFDITTQLPLPLEDFGGGVLGNFPRGVFLANGKAYVSDFSVPEKVYVFDVATGASLPTKDVGFGVLNAPFSSFIIGDKIYVCDTLDGVRTFNRTNGEYLDEEDITEDTLFIISMQTVNNKAYLLDASSDEILVYKQNLSIDFI